MFNFFLNKAKYNGEIKIVAAKAFHCEKRTAEMSRPLLVTLKKNI